MSDGFCDLCGARRPPVDGEGFCMACAVVEIDRLQAIVDKIPKTADHVRVFGGETIYRPFKTHAPIVVVGTRIQSSFDISECCFDITAAAQAAKEKP